MDLRRLWRAGESAGAAAARAPEAGVPAARAPAAGAAPANDALPGDLLRQVRRLEIRTRAVVSELFAGQYHSVFKGQGMEFAEVREYVPGDDIRTIDWNVTARAGAPFVKQYVEEREMTVFLLVDVSGSQRFGSANRSKQETAAEAAALLAFSAIQNHDKVGWLAFSEAIEQLVPPRKGRTHGLRLIREILAFRAEGRGTDLAAACDAALHALKRRSLVLLLSDFLPPPDRWERALSLLSRKHDVVALEIRDRAEVDWPALGLVEWEDPETGRRVLADTSDPLVRRRQARLGGERREGTAACLRRLGVDQVVLEVGGDPVEPLLAFFRLRERRRARE
ncbi:MAG: DUF58 domain-containing protein [Candidatus Eisenbacteria bacterium]|uniref:DUF58 domain-containing protein n=1 Tax=Eiseniibacteriota bacterium TaxID=2212470 RepID=A0A937XA22_UNCEI|nr:DUF58 domain-containing protein [Candidatus Eisenbacteria bacterium]